MPDERGLKTFKERKTFAQRREEALGIRAKFPQKVPVIVERYHKEKSLPALDKTKFLVPQEITMSQFVTIIRNRMSLGSTQAFYLIVNNKSIASMSTALSELYRDERDADGFLYMTYASHEMFGKLSSAVEKFSSSFVSTSISNFASPTSSTPALLHWQSDDGVQEQQVSTPFC